MISLVGGELYQWDTGRIVRVVPDENVKVHEVHFSTKRMDYAYVLKTYIVDGVTYCAIPNIILQQSNRLLCYEVCENSDGEETIANTYFDIIKRNRPEDYVYTEQDHFTIQALSNRVDKLEESSHTHINKTELDTITKEDLETWRSPNSSAITGGAQVGTLFEDLEVTTTLAEDASEWTSASSQPFKCTFRPSPGQMVVVKVKDLDVDTITTAKIPPTGYPLGQTIIGNYSVVNSRLQSWYNDADSVPPTPNDAQANSCLVFEDQYYDSEHLTPSLPTCILYTKTPGTYKVTVTTLKHSIGPESVVKMYDVRPSTFAEYGTYTNWKDLTKSGKYDLWEVSIKKTNYYNGVYLKEVNGTKYIYVYRSEQKKDPESGIFTTTDYTLTYDTATETVTCSDTTINPETDVIISVHLDQVISTVPDNATSLGKPSADKVGKMLTTVDLGEGAIDNKWQSRRYEYQWVDAPKGGSADVVKYTEQTLTDDQKAQARTNIGAVSVDTLPVASRVTKGVGYVDFEGSGSDTNTFDYDLYETIGIENERFCYTPAIRGNFNTKLSVAFLKKNLQYSGGHAKSYLFGSADEDIANSLSLIDKDFPITVTVMNSDYHSPPTWYYLMVTARGRTGKFALKATESVISSANPYTSFINPERKELPLTDGYVLGNIDENGNLWSYRTLNSFAKHNVFSKDTVLYQMTDANKPIAYIFGSGDETVSSLNLTASNYPVVVTYTGYEIMYNTTPKFSYIITTADGKKGTFTWFVKDNNPSPITWTFEGGGGGNSLFIITPTYNDDTKTWSTDRTWDEVKAALAKSENPNDYAIILDGSLLSPNSLAVGRNGSGEIANVQMLWFIINPMVVDANTVPDGFGSGLVPFSSYINIKYNASSSNINFTYAESGNISQAIIKSALISKSDDGTLVCDPPNAVELFGGFLTTEEPIKAQFICPLFYNGETYHFETGEKDSSNIISLYFSTITNGIYKRLKITQGQNGAADTVVMDKEIELNTKSFLVDFASGPSHWTSNKTAKEIYDAANQGLRVVNNVYGLILINWHYNEVKDKYNLVFSTSGYTADNLIVAKLSATFVDSSFKGDWEFQFFDCDGVFNVLNDSDIKTGSILSVQAWNNHKPISWKAVDVLTTTNITAFTPTEDYHPATKKYVDDSIKAVPVDGTTIKFNEYGQLTLALSNANGVSF